MVPCPYCGSPIRRTASSCPVCGSDERTGWSDGRYLDGIDLPDEDEYDEMVAKEFGLKSERKAKWRNWHSVTGAVVLLFFLFLLLRTAC